MYSKNLPTVGGWSYHGTMILDIIVISAVAWGGTPTLENKIFFGVSLVFKNSLC